MLKTNKKNFKKCKNNNDLFDKRDKISCLFIYVSFLIIIFA